MSNLPYECFEVNKYTGARRSNPRLDKHIRNGHSSLVVQLMLLECLKPIYPELNNARVLSTRDHMRRSPHFSKYSYCEGFSYHTNLG